MKNILSAVILSMLACASAFAQDNGSDESDDKTLLSIVEGPFTAEFANYFSLGDHIFFGTEVYFDTANKNSSSEFVFNIIELRVRPYQGAHFCLGLDFDWDYYRLSKEYYWLPDASKQSVTIASRERGGFKRIKKSNLNVRTVSVPLSFEQDFGKCSLRIGAAGEYNFPGRTRFKAIDNSEAKVKETRSGERFADQIKTNPFTYSAFAALSFEGAGFYVKYSPKPVFEEAAGPQFKTLTIGVICGLGK
ncbi:MAG: hypothetical protein IJK73_02730 [Bacteroidales bacterium]|nr:hypothetical protein [Bacteroidales bacterium]